MTNDRVLPRLVIGGVASGVGKTTLTVALIRALRARGLRVATFKCGPDYLDPTYHARAGNGPCHNLDGWMMGREAVLDTFRNATRAADCAVLEGVMGLFDGASPTGEEGSTAEIAKWLDAPVVLVLDAAGMARSVAALAQGFAAFDRGLAVAGVICNRVGSRGHLDLLRSALRAPPILGGFPEEAAIALPERHLGLHTASRETLPDALLDRLGALADEWLDVDALLQVAASAGPLPSGGAPPLVARVSAPDVRIGVAHDAAFHFYYDHNLRQLEACGAELVRFSPLADRVLPPVDGIYIGGGYPEVHAAELSANAPMRAALARFAAAGGPIYGECGGLMYLCGGIRTLEGRTYPMVGLLSGEAVMADRLQALGYVEVETQAASLFGDAGLRFRGHQFRYSTLAGAAAAEAGLYRVRTRHGSDPFAEGYHHGTVIGSYVHAHWASNPLVPRGFVAACRRYAEAHA